MAFWVDPLGPHRSETLKRRRDNLRLLPRRPHFSKEPIHEAQYPQLIQLVPALQPHADLSVDLLGVLPNSRTPTLGQKLL